ncbi:MAG: zinc-ribbon domain-containing protein [Dehalococcoidales bacterium]|nr:zinc-ribbon domain-containing protein [Dehalococcoidales bacterium]
MWLFLFGNKDYYDRLGYITMKCPGCKTRDVFAVEQERKKLTIYFVPTFQYSKKQLLVCGTCHETFEVAKELKPELAKKIMSREKLQAKIDRRKRATSQKKPATSGSQGICPNCQNIVAGTMAYCPSCGSRL